MSPQTYKPYNWCAGGCSWLSTAPIIHFRYSSWRWRIYIIRWLVNWLWTNSIQSSVLQTIRPWSLRRRMKNHSSWDGTRMDLHAPIVWRRVFGNIVTWYFRALYPIHLVPLYLDCIMLMPFGWSLFTGTHCPIVVPLVIRILNHERMGALLSSIRQIRFQLRLYNFFFYIRRRR